MTFTSPNIEALAERSDLVTRLGLPDERRALRTNAGVRQEDVARALNVSAPAVSRWESGDRVPRGDHLHAYVGVLDWLRREASSGGHASSKTEAAFIKGGSVASSVSNRAS